jgi:hypothetical protein
LSALPVNFDRHQGNADDIHKRKIDVADELFMIDVGGYIGESIRSEIEHAKTTVKVIRYLYS